MTGSISALSALGTLALALGTVAAGLAPSRPEVRIPLEYAGGFLLAGGLALVGLGLPLFR